MADKPIQNSAELDGRRPFVSKSNKTAKVSGLSASRDIRGGDHALARFSSFSSQINGEDALVNKLKVSPGRSTMNSISSIADNVRFIYIQMW